MNLSERKKISRDRLRRIFRADSLLKIREFSGLNDRSEEREDAVKRQERCPKLFFEVHTKELIKKNENHNKV